MNLDDFITEIQLDLPNFTVQQQNQLKDVLLKHLYPYDLCEKSTELITIDDSSYHILQKFCTIKKLEGLQLSSIKQYYKENVRLLESMNKNFVDMNTDDIRMYLAMKNVSNQTMNNSIRYLNTFFKWLHEEEYIDRNPMIKIHSVKTEKLIKKPFSQVELQKIREACKNNRDRAIVETLYSTGCRISELCNININDIRNDEIVVFGKGAKERIVYLNDVAKYYLNIYFQSRNDNNPALFVSSRAPHDRIKPGSVEKMFRELSASSGIENIHPHRFRRTVATNLGNKGMKLEEIQRVLGHTNIETTLRYYNVDQNSVKHNHHRLI